MGRSVTKICQSCQTIVKKRNKKSCPKCGGKIAALTQELINKICRLKEEREKRAKKKKIQETQKKPWTGGEIW